MHTGRPTSMALSHCITWFQTQSILTCQIHYHSHFGIIVALNSSESWFRALCPRCMSSV